MAAGAGVNALAYSTNGVNWTGVPGSTTLFGSWGNAVAYNYYQDLWIAGGNGTTYKFAYSKDAYTWTGIASATSAFTNVRALAYSSSQWVACGDGTDTLAYSKDGFTWTGKGSTIHTNGTGVAYSLKQDLWLATGYGTNKLSYSKDGFNWTGITGSTIFTQYGMEVAYSQNQNIWTAVGGYTTNTIAYSANGFNWTGVPSNTSVLSEIGWAVGYSENQNLWVAGGQTTNSLGYSSNGYNWTGIAGSATVNSNVDSIKYNSVQNIWIAGGNSAAGNTLLYSTNGLNWTGQGSTVFNSNVPAIACSDFLTPTFYIDKTTFTSAIPTKDTTGNFNISTSQVSPTMVLDASRGYCYKINNNGFGLYWNYNYKSAITVSFWLRYTGTNTNQFNDIGSLCDASGNYRMYTQFPAGTPNKSTFGGYNSGTADITNSTPVTCTNPNWFMVSITWNGTTAGIYINGAAYRSTATGFVGTIALNSGGVICIGSLDKNISAVSANGLLSSIYVWDQVLTDVQLNAAYTIT